MRAVGSCLDPDIQGSKRCQRARVLFGWQGLLISATRGDSWAHSREVNGGIEGDQIDMG